jgi:large conductance mechanosensitive channel
MKAFFQDFKEFAIKGNVIDMAVGIIIGAVFTTIVQSLVKDILTPLISVFTSGVDVSQKKIVLREAIAEGEGGAAVEAIELRYGLFMENVLDFLIVGLVVFMLVRIFNRLKRKGEDPKEKSTPTPKDIQLLTEIRDALRSSGPKEP